MKKTILSIAVVSALLVSCNETKHKHETHETTEGVHEHDASTEFNQSEAEGLVNHEKMVPDVQAINNFWVNDIKLDNGTKWQANIETTTGVEKMLSLVKSSEAKTVEDYHTLASKLNEYKNEVVKKCTMKGASHDNLHIFLHPLIEKIEALGKITTVDEGVIISASIKENIEGYFNYFQ